MKNECFDIFRRKIPLRSSSVVSYTRFENTTFKYGSFRIQFIVFVKPRKRLALVLHTCLYLLREYVRKIRIKKCTRERLAVKRIFVDRCTRPSDLRSDLRVDFLSFLCSVSTAKCLYINQHIVILLDIIGSGFKMYTGLLFDNQCEGHRDRHGVMTA